MSTKVEEFVQFLLQGTRSGTLRWTETAELGLYRLMLTKGLVRIYRVGPHSPEEEFIGCTVLNADGELLYDKQFPRMEGSNLAKLYDLVDGSFKDDAMDALLEELKQKLQASDQPVTAAPK